MAEPKTRPSDASVEDFLDSVAAERRRDDCRRVAALLERVTGEPPRMWGDSIIGFGSYHYRYASGREGDWFVAGVSPRKAALTVYVMPGLDAHRDLLAKLGRHRTGKCCLYLKRLEDVDLAVLEAIVARAGAALERIYGR